MQPLGVHVVVHEVDDGSQRRAGAKVAFDTQLLDGGDVFAGLGH